MGISMNSFAVCAQLRRRGTAATLKWGSHFNDAALQAYGDGMRSISGAQFFHDQTHVAFDGIFSDTQATGDIAIRKTKRSGLQYLQFPGAEALLANVLRQLTGDLGRNMPSACRQLADSFNQLLAQTAFQQVCLCTCQVGAGS
jgi:hypothetical protein